MILVLVFFGVVAGSTAAVLAFVGGGGFLGALAAYALFGAVAVGLTALLMFLAPSRAIAEQQAEWSELNEWAEMSLQQRQSMPRGSEQAPKRGPVW
ncbi:MAG: hypothetical protein P8X69_07005, partial [Maritimibacter sp.]